MLVLVTTAVLVLVTTAVLVLVLVLVTTAVLLLVVVTTAVVMTVILIRARAGGAVHDIQDARVSALPHIDKCRERALANRAQCHLVKCHLVKCPHPACRGRYCCVPAGPDDSEEGCRS